MFQENIRGICRMTKNQIVEAYRNRKANTNRNNFRPADKNSKYEEQTH